MSIDLSKAKLGDKFITKEGRILTLAYQGRKYTLIGRGCFVRLNQNGKLYEDNEESKFDLIEQVFDNGDLLDNHISVEQRGEVLAEMTKSEFEKARELGIDFLHVYIEQNPKEDNQELQRRQEVLKYADILFFNQRDTRVALFGYDEAIETAEIIVEVRDKYLKGGVSYERTLND